MTLLEIFNILEQIKNTSSRNEKERKLLLYCDGTKLKTILVYTYDPYKVYGIGKKAFSSNVYGESRFNSLFEMLECLEINNTGTDAIKLEVNKFINKHTKFEQEWIKKILLKDLGAGITGKTINKVFPGLVPTFDCMLAYPFEKYFESVACEVKIDGVRMIAIKKNNSVVLYTRNGKIIEGYNDIVSNVKNIGIDNVVFDGEIVGKNYTDTMNNLFRKEKEKSGTYMIFDMLTIDEFMDGESKDDYYTRKLAISNIKKNINEKEFSFLKFIEPVAMLQNPTIDQLNEISNQVVNQGYEGIMIKDYTAKYKAKRDYGWQKFKPFYTEEFNIIGFMQGEGKYQNTLGKVFIDVDGITVGCGSGFSDLQRDEIWNNKEKYLGQLIEIQYQEKIVKTGSLRFPTVKSIRKDI